MRQCKDMPYHAGIKIRLYPSTEQKRLIAVNDGAGRFVYNRLVALNNERHRLTKNTALVPAYRARLEYIDSVIRNPDVIVPTALKNAAPFLYGNDVDAQTVENAVKNYRGAWKKFREEPSAGVPVFHHKSYEQSYQTNAHYKKDAVSINDSNVRFDGKGHILLPKLGRVRYAGSSKRIRSLVNRQDTRIGTIRIWRDSVGRYYASLQVASEYPFADPFPKTGAAVGIDVNIDNFAYDSNNNVTENPKYRRSLQEKLAKAQRKMSRRAERAKAEGRKLTESRNYQKARKKAAYLYGRITARGKDFRHRVSKAYVENQDIIVVEDLKVKNLLRNHRLAFAISECGWSDFLCKLEYKSVMYDRIFIKVPPHYTTQTCSACGHVMSGDDHLSLDVRDWICPACGTYHLRDHNAAKNVLARGLAILGLAADASGHGNSPG